jgi:hypothetical protein
LKNSSKYRDLMLRIVAMRRFFPKDFTLSFAIEKLPE